MIWIIAIASGVITIVASGYLLIGWIKRRVCMTSERICAGLCITCGEEPPLSHILECADCYDARQR